ncbi:MAG TPA: MFS transporter [Patescibacteria group bacterium]|nr:MFS transporter [Patescibacteria group bacterium]
MNGFKNGFIKEFFKRIIPAKIDRRGKSLSLSSFLFFKGILSFSFKNLAVWKRNLAVLWLAQLIAMIGMSAFMPFLPLYIRDYLGVTTTEDIHRWSGFIYAGPFILSVFATPVWGALGDRYGRKAMVLRAIFGLAIAISLMGFAVTPWQFFLLRVFQGAVSGFIAANLSFVSSETPQEHTGYALGILQTATSGGTVAGPLLGGILSDMAGMRNVFFIVGGMCLLSGIIIIHQLREERRPGTSKSKSSPLANLRYAWQQTSIRGALLVIIVAQASIVFAGPIFALYIESLGAPVENLKTITGVMIGVVGLCSVIFAPFWGKRNDSAAWGKTLSMAAIVVSVAVTLQGFVPRYEYLFPLRLIIGVFVAAIIPGLYSVLSKQSPADIRGGIMGLASSATLLGNLISPTVSSWIAAHYGMRWCFGVAGAMMLAVAVFARRLATARK